MAALAGHLYVHIIACVMKVTEDNCTRASRSDEELKASAYLLENLTDPKTAFSEEPDESALNRAFGTNITMWEWFEQPENALRLKRFGVGMKGTVEAHNPKAILDRKTIFLRLASWLIIPLSSPSLEDNP